MRKAETAFERRKPPLIVGRDRAARELVCLALILAIAALLCRIANIW